MLKTACPSCGGQIVFKSKTSILCVCPYCRSNVVRHGVDLSLVGKQSELQEDMSPIQIGSLGRFKSKSFQVLGRQILGWSDGRWNEWYIMFQDGSDGWIAEAQGEFFINFRNSEKISDYNEESRSINIGGIEFQQVDKKEVKCIGSEGELPFKVVEGTESKVLDYSDFEGRFASIEFQSDENLVYVGQVVTLRDLKMKGLKVFEGWGRTRF